MPDSQPNSAPDTLPADARDPATPGAVLNDTDGGKTPGGGGLGGAAAADGADRTPSGTSRNAPIDVTVPPAAIDDDGVPASAASEARRQAADDAPEPHPSSR